MKTIRELNDVPIWLWLPCCMITTPWLLPVGFIYALFHILYNRVVLKKPKFEDSPHIIILILRPAFYTSFYIATAIFKWIPITKENQKND